MIGVNCSRASKYHHDLCRRYGQDGAPEFDDGINDHQELWAMPQGCGFWVYD